MIERCYADDKMSVIPKDILNDGCEIVGDENFPENWEREEQQRVFLDLSDDISGDLSSGEDFGPVSDLTCDEDDQLR